MRIRRGPATVTGGSRFARAPTSGASHWASHADREGAEREARKPGDLPPAITLERPRGRGGSCPIVSRSARRSARRPRAARARPGGAARRPPRCGSSATSQGIDTTAVDDDRAGARPARCAGQQRRRRRSTRRSTATGTATRSSLDDPRRDARPTSTATSGASGSTTRTRSDRHLRRTTSQAGDRILLLRRSATTRRSPATIFPLVLVGRARDRRRRRAVHGHGLRAAHRRHDDHAGPGHGATVARRRRARARRTRPGSATLTLGPAGGQ